MREIMSFAIVLLLGMFSPFEAMEQITQDQEPKKSYFQILKQSLNYKPTNNKVAPEGPFEYEYYRMIAILKREGVLPQNFNLKYSENLNHQLDYFRRSIRKEKVKTEGWRIWQVGTALETIPFVEQCKAHQFLIEYLRDRTIDPSVTKFVDAFVSLTKSNQSSIEPANTMKNAFKLIWFNVRKITTFLCRASKSIASHCKPSDVLSYIVAPPFIFATFCCKNNNELLYASIGFFSAVLGLLSMTMGFDDLYLSFMKR